MAATFTTKTVRAIAAAEKFIGLTIDEATAFYTGGVCKTLAALIERNAKTGYTPKYTTDGRKKRAFTKVLKTLGIKPVRKFAMAEAA